VGVNVQGPSASNRDPVVFQFGAPRVTISFVEVNEQPVVVERHNERANNSRFVLIFMRRSLQT
jgi:hypothetical protein